MPRKDARTGSPGSGGEATSIRGVRPWGEFAKKYFDAGWCPLPLPARKKSSPPTGTTGKYEMPDKKKIIGWHKQKDPRGNIAIRVPEGVIGIDVDAYDDKVGERSLSTLISDLGPLPETWTLTARGDGVSGIRFFRVPPGLHWSGEPIADVQIVQNHHRYAVAYPSVHPDIRKTYLWYAPGDALNGAPSVTVEHEIPTLEDLAALPEDWVQAFSGGRVWKGLAADADATAGDLIAWLKGRPGGNMCRLMRKQTEAAIAEMSVGGAHDSLNARIYSVVSLATEGHAGVGRAIRRIRDAFYAEVTRDGRKGKRTVQSARLEFNRVRDGAVRIMMASCADGESSLEDECGCAGSSLDWGEKLGLVVSEPDGESPLRKAKLGKSKPPDKYPFDDSGNAEHMLDILDGSAAWVSDESSWYFWNTDIGAWQRNPSGSRAMNVAQQVGRRCREQAEEFAEKLISAGSSPGTDGGLMTAKIKDLYAHAVKSSNRAGLESMVKIATTQPRAERLAEDFDSSPDLLACPNGTLQLTDSGVVFRRAAREDMLSLCTRTPYVEGASFEAWEAYLLRFLPSVELRRYLQKVAGYTLYGENSERLMFYLKGGTSTGKTTFVNAFSGALGQYAGTMNLSIFRANQDEKPRPDLVRGIRKRLLSASEASSEWHLHGDQVKRLTGGDPVSARDLFVSESVDRVPAFTPWVATNATPQTHGVDKALWRRVRGIPFDVTVAEGAEDVRFGRALRSIEGRTAVLAWAVEGWSMYRADGHLQAPSEVLVATADLRREMSDVDVFLDECCKESSGAETPFSSLFERWSEWCMENNVKNNMTSVMLGRELTGRGYARYDRRIKGVVTKVRLGILLRKRS